MSSHDQAFCNARRRGWSRILLLLVFVIVGYHDRISDLLVIHLAQVVSQGEDNSARGQLQPRILAYLPYLNPLGSC